MDEQGDDFVLLENQTYTSELQTYLAEIQDRIRQVVPSPTVRGSVAQKLLAILTNHERQSGQAFADNFEASVHLMFQTKPRLANPGDSDQQRDDAPPKEAMSHVGDLLDCLLWGFVVFDLYNAETRYVVREFAKQNNVPFAEVQDKEISVCERCLAAKTQHSHVDDINAVARVAQATSNQDTNMSWATWACVGGAATAGALALGYTGGAAAPLMGSSLGTMASASGMSVELATLVSTTAGSSWMSYLFGVAGASLVSQKTIRRLSGITEFHFSQVSGKEDTEPADGLSSLAGEGGAVSGGGSGGAVSTGEGGAVSTGEGGAVSTGEGDTVSTGQLATGSTSSRQEDNFVQVPMPPDEYVEEEWVQTDNQLFNLEIGSRSNLSLCLAISGWIHDKCGFSRPWQCLKEKGCAFQMKSSDVLALHWASEELVDLNNSVQRILKTEFISQIAGACLRQTAFHSLMSALAWPGAVVKMSEVIDNAWSVVKAKADKTGVTLAELIAARVYGTTPITMVAFSWGARVVYSCLKHLRTLSRKDPRLLNIVEQCFIFGAPVRVDQEIWRELRKMVAGRFVNGYSRNDWVLSFCYRNEPTAYFSNFTRIAGLDGVGCDGVEDMDLSACIKTQADYMSYMKAILGRCDL